MEHEDETLQEDHLPAVSYNTSSSLAVGKYCAGGPGQNFPSNFHSLNKGPFLLEEALSECSSWKL